YHDAGRLDDAVRMFTKALELQRRIYGEEHPITLATAGNLATAHLAQGEAELAVAEFERLDRLYRARFGDRPHPDQAHNLGWQAIARYRAGDAAAAARTLGAARAMAAALPPSDAVNLEWLEPLGGPLRVELGAHDDGRLRRPRADALAGTLDLHRLGLARGRRGRCLPGPVGRATARAGRARPHGASLVGGMVGPARPLRRCRDRDAGQSRDRGAAGAGSRFPGLAGRCPAGAGAGRRPVDRTLRLDRKSVE